MMKALIIFACAGLGSTVFAEESYPNLDCLRAGVVLSNVKFVEIGDPVALPKVVGRIENDLPWAITGFRFDYGVEDTATGTVWARQYDASDLLEPPLMPGEVRDFVTYSGHFDAESNDTIQLTPTMWDVMDPDGLELVNDHRAVTVASYQRPRSQRTC